MHHQEKNPVASGGEHQEHGYPTRNKKICRAQPLIRSPYGICRGGGFVTMKAYRNPATGA